MVRVMPLSLYRYCVPTVANRLPSYSPKPPPLAGRRAVRSGLARASSSRHTLPAPSEAPPSCAER